MSEVSVFKSDADDRDALIAEFFEKFPFYSADDRKRILEAWAFLLEISGGSKNPDGEPYYLHPLRLAFILAEGEFDVDTVISALLHGTPSKGVSKPTIEEKFGREVSKIVFGAAKFINIPVETSKTLLQADAIRKMLFAMTDDVRIIFLKLSDRLDRIRNIKSFAPELQKALATEVIDIWAPLADRLGMQTAKNELEDLSLKYTNPSAYKQIKNVISQKKEERAAYLENAVNTIKSAAEKQRIQVSITSRAKHFYSIYQKMRKRNKDAGELYDLLALRLICQHKSDCYTLIGIVHGLWQPLEGRFKDYIAMPKSNGYQSLHTTVMCDGRPLEIQIRTEKMHEFAEHGVASHWLYKKGTNRDVVDVKNLEIFNQLSKIKEAKIPDDEIFQNYKNELLADEIVVFTPKGDVKKLPIGSTAIDFAY
ncbi:MAG: HD domain-containing protein, partial [Treponema sp.]